MSRWCLSMMFVVLSAGGAYAQGTPIPEFTVRVADSTTIVGLGGGVTFSVESSAPAAVFLRVTSLASGQSVVVDSAGPGRAAQLTFRPVVTNPPRYPSGAYQVAVVGRSADGSESVVRFRAVVVAPPLRLEQVPVAIDPSELTPTRRRPPILKSLLSGVVLGGAGYAAGTVFRPSGAGNGEASSGRAFTMGITLALITTIGSQFVESPPDPGAVARNRHAQARFEERRSLVAGFNDLAEREYRATVLLTREPS